MIEKEGSKFRSRCANDRLLS